MSPDIIPRRMASPGGAMSEGHGIMSPDIIPRRMASPGGAMSEGHRAAALVGKEEPHDL